MEMIEKMLSEFYGSGEYSTRTAKITMVGDVFMVWMYEEDVLVRGQSITDHTLQYAEDCAENWVTGVIKE